MAGEFEFKSIEDAENEANSGKTVATISLNLSMRVPCFEPEFEIKSKPNIKIQKCYPSFQNHSVDNEIPNEDSQPIDNNVNINNTKKVSANDANKKVEVKKALENLHPTVEIDIKQFSQDEIDNPDSLDCIVSIKILEIKQQELDNEIKKISGRTPQQLREKFLKLKIKLNVIFFNFYLDY